MEPVNFAALRARMPLCTDVATTGEKATNVLASLTGTEVPGMGESVTTSDGLRLWRMPSPSRAYPLALEKKAAYYRRLFQSAAIPGLLP